MFRTHVCGGVIITQTHVLTCGHCVTMTGGDVYGVIAGSTVINTMIEPNAQERRVRRVTLHKDYTPRLLRNDIAVLTLAAPFEWSTVVQAANLVAQGHVVEPSTPAYTWGWGLTEESKNGYAFALQNRLQAAKMSSTANSDCEKVYGARFVQPEVACISNFMTKQDACQVRVTYSLKRTEFVQMNVNSNWSGRSRWSGGHWRR